MKPTNDQLRLARQVLAKRSEALRIVRMYPTLPQIAEQLGCSHERLRKELSNYGH